MLCSTSTTCPLTVLLYKQHGTWTVRGGSCCTRIAQSVSLQLEKFKIESRPVGPTSWSRVHVANSNDMSNPILVRSVKTSARKWAHKNWSKLISVPVLSESSESSELIVASITVESKSSQLYLPPQLQRLNYDN